MIFITGDIHGFLDIDKLSDSCFYMFDKITRNDYLIICGDFGLLFDNSKEELHWRKWLDDKPWTTLWIDGNHENFDMIKEYPVEDWHGGKIQKITDNIFHLCRGYVFEIEGKKIFAFGGAESHDKEWRELGISIWNEEVPSEEEIEQGRKSLDAVDWNVDIVITHSLSTKLQEKIFSKYSGYGVNIQTDFFGELDVRLNFDMWFSGHYHCDFDHDNKHFLIYENIVMLTENGFERIYPRNCSKYVLHLPDIFEMQK